MRKRENLVNIKIVKTLLLLALWCCVSAPVNTLGGGWGIERGRANEGDAGGKVEIWRTQ